MWEQHIVYRKDSCLLNMAMFDLALPCEQVHIKICKQSLHVPQKAANISTFAECDREMSY